MWLGGSPFLLLVLVAVAAWLWGSFLNQLVDRIPARTGRRGSPSRKVTLFHPLRSVCLNCRSPICWYDNVPIFAYLWLRGRCRTCGAPIGRRTLVMEVAVPVVLVIWHALARYDSLSRVCTVWGDVLLSGVLVALALVWEHRFGR